MLKLWFPFSKDSRNCGLAEGMSTSVNVNFNTDGVLYGKCASFNGSTSYVSVPHGIDTDAKQFTFSTFVYVNNTGNQCLYSQRTSVGGGVSIFYLNGKIRFDCSNDLWETNAAIPASTWTHVAATFNGKKKKVFINGALVQEKDFTAQSMPNIAVMAVVGGAESTDGGVPASYFLNGYLNDTRVYDHALSDFEVRMLYHKQMISVDADLRLEPTTNLAATLTPRANNGGWGAMQATMITPISYHLKHDYGNSNLSYWSTFTYTLPEGYANKVVTFSATLKNISYHDLNASTSWLFIGQGNEGQYPTHGSVTHYYKDLYEGQRISWTGEITASNRYLIIELWNNDTTTSGCIEMDLENIQIEEGNHTTPPTLLPREDTYIDLSGYGNPLKASNVVQSGTSLYFNGTSSQIEIPMSASTSGGNFTLNIWFYRKNGEWSSQPWEDLIGGSGFAFASKSGGTNSPIISLYNWGHHKIPYEYDKWNMITMVRSSSNVKVYLNGELKVTSTTRGSNPSGPFYIGQYFNNTEHLKGYVRNVAVFKSELTDDDIKKLYLYNYK